ncbi:transposase [Phytophthora cinnamomi]|uniref:transposase n=1 Tax=Phytophthora cinnamomi TaxID=4785 RepID=UPI00355A6D28|nr:transposase [Phytophthora cinnamomi]
MTSSNDTPASPSSTQHNYPAPSILRPGRKLDAAWDKVDIDPQGGVWCKKCKAPLQTTDRNHVERIKHHLSKRCTAQGTTTLITDTYRPRIKSELTKKFQE